MHRPTLKHPLQHLTPVSSRRGSFMVWPWFFCRTVFVCPQSPYRGNDIIFWIFPDVLCQAFWMWHWPICKNVDMSFIWGHQHLHLVGMDDQSIAWLLHYLLHCVDETQQGRKGYPIHGCNYWLSVWTLSCRFASLFSSLPLFGWNSLFFNRLNFNSVKSTAKIKKKRRFL